MTNDFDVSVFIITENNEYIISQEYDKTDDGNGMFVCLTNDEINSDYDENNSICIYKDWLNEIWNAKSIMQGEIEFQEHNGYISCEWQIEDIEIPNVFKLDESKFNNNFNSHQRTLYIKQFLDGYKQCNDIMTNVVPLLKGKTKDEYIPAIMLSHHTQVEFNNKIYHGYLPAIGQMMYISVNIVDINNALSKIVDKYIKLFIVENRKFPHLSSCWWSSNEENCNGAWFISNEELAMEAFKSADIVRVLPIFKLQ